MLPKFLTSKNLAPNVTINPDLNYLGTETAFGFGAKVMEVEKSGKFPQVYKFHIGDTGPKTPQAIIDVAIKALQDKQTKYAPYLGYPQVRENIAKYWTKTRGVEIKKENIILMPGGKPGIEVTMQALLCPGDKVIYQNPGYPIYESLARLYSKGNQISWAAYQHPENKKLEYRVEDLAKILEENKNVKILCLNTPQNPTGMMLTRAQLEAIAELVRKYKFFVLFDDIYDQIVFNGQEHFSFLSIPGMLDYTVNLNGYSKNYAMTGWRLGFMVGPEWLIEIFGQFAINKWSCVSRTNQIVAGAVFGDVEVDGCKYECIWDKIQPILKADFAEYEKKGKFLVDCLRLLSPYVIPNDVEGAFYDFPNFEGVLNLKYVKEDLNIKNEKDLNQWLLFERGIATLAGSDFGSAGAGYLRFSYAEDREKHIIPGMKHLLKTVIELVEKSGSPRQSEAAADGSALLKREEVDEKVEEIKNKHFGN